MSLFLSLVRLLPVVPIVFVRAASPEEGACVSILRADTVCTCACACHVLVDCMPLLAQPPHRCVVPLRVLQAGKLLSSVVFVRLRAAAPSVCVPGFLFLVFLFGLG